MIVPSREDVQSPYSSWFQKLSQSDRCSFQKVSIIYLVHLIATRLSLRPSILYEELDLGASSAFGRAIRTKSQFTTFIVQIRGTHISSLFTLTDYHSVRDLPWFHKYSNQRLLFWMVLTTFQSESTKLSHNNFHQKHPFRNIYNYIEPETYVGLASWSY